MTLLFHVAVHASHHLFYHSEPRNSLEAGLTLNSSLHSSDKAHQVLHGMSRYKTVSFANPYCILIWKRCELMARVSVRNATVCDPFIIKTRKRTEDAEIPHISLQHLTCFTVI